VLGASLATLSWTMPAPRGPKAVVLPRLAWIVFFTSGREAIGEYRASIYDGWTGQDVWNVVILWWSSRTPGAGQPVGRRLPG
jgi:hypothetical protein